MRWIDLVGRAQRIATELRWNEKNPALRISCEINALLRNHVRNQIERSRLAGERRKRNTYLACIWVGDMRCWTQTHTRNLNENVDGVEGGITTVLNRSRIPFRSSEIAWNIRRDFY